MTFLQDLASSLGLALRPGLYLILCAVTARCSGHTTLTIPQHASGQAGSSTQVLFAPFCAASAPAPPHTHPDILPSYVSTVVPIDVSHNPPVPRILPVHLSAHELKIHFKGSCVNFLLFFTHYGSSVIVKYMNGWALMCFKDEGIQECFFFFFLILIVIESPECFFTYPSTEDYCMLMLDKINVESLLCASP